MVLVLSGLSAQGAQVVVLGLFKDKAVVVVDGKQRTLSVGQTSPEGVTLVSANSNGAVLDIAGTRSTYPLGSQVNTNLGAPAQTTVQLYRDQQGMYATSGSINGQPVNFLVDTGATLVSMNSTDARRLGINFRLGQASAVTTASGVEPAYQVRLNKVKVGDIELRDVDGLVLDGPHPPLVLLGMSFLGRLDMQNKGQVMELRQKH
jgi:aspartyl protease family protein